KTYVAQFPHLKSDQVRLLIHKERKEIDLIACPDEGAKVPHEAAWDFETFDNLFDGLEKMLDRFKQEGKDESEVMFDVTGGQKPNSIVAALVTVNRHAKFQYVRTNDPSKVKAYDLIADPQRD